LEVIVKGVEDVERKLEDLKAPWTPGRIPELD